MKQFQQQFILLIVLILLVNVGCAPQTSSSGNGLAEGVVVVATRPVETVHEDLPLLPALWPSHAHSTGEQLPGGEQDPFAEATFTLATTLPAGRETAVVQQYNFGQPEAAQARLLADK